MPVHFFYENNRGCGTPFGQTGPRRGGISVRARQEPLSILQKYSVPDKQIRRGVHVLAYCKNKKKHRQEEIQI